MRLFEYIRIAIEGLFVNKFRSLLTMLGIIIGITNIIVVVAVLQGARANILKELAALGKDLLYVYPIDYGDLSERAYITQDEIEAMKRLPLIADVTPQVFLFTDIKVGREPKRIELIGTTPNSEKTERIKVKAGRFLSYSDLKKAQRVCVLPETLSKELFGEVNPLNRNLRIKGTIFKIIGIMEERMLDVLTQRFMGDIEIYIPLTTAQRILGVKDVSFVIVLAKPGSESQVLTKQIKEFLKKRHGGKEVFEVGDLKGIVKATEEITGIIALVIGCIAAVALVVGGIGIMNMMLVQVRERTREIGLRKAVGAAKGDITLQFLIESCMLSLGGGIIGIIIGILLANIVAFFIRLPFFISLEAVVLGFCISSGIGIFFGVYPAVIASKLDPIEALRYE